MLHSRVSFRSPDPELGLAVPESQIGVRRCSSLYARPLNLPQSDSDHWRSLPARPPGGLTLSPAPDRPPCSQSRDRAGWMPAVPAPPIAAPYFLQGPTDPCAVVHRTSIRYG